MFLALRWTKDQLYRIRIVPITCLVCSDLLKLVAKNYGQCGKWAADKKCKKWLHLQFMLDYCGVGTPKTVTKI